MAHTKHNREQLTLPRHSPNQQHSRGSLAPRSLAMPLTTDTVCAPPGVGQGEDLRGQEGRRPREGTVDGTAAIPALGLRTCTQVSPDWDGTGPDTPREPRAGSSQSGREQHSAPAPSGRTGTAGSPEKLDRLGSSWRKASKPKGTRTPQQEENPLLNWETDKNTAALSRAVLK